MIPGLWKTCSDAPKDPYQIICNGNEITIYSLIFNRKYNSPTAYLIPMKPPPTPKLTVSSPHTSDASGQSSQFLGGLYMTLSGLIESDLPATGPWAMAGKALFYLVKLGSIIWWTMLVPASDPPFSEGASKSSWYPETPSLVGRKSTTRTSSINTDKAKG
ncbi:hypothetical protein DSO57_1010308 [Entomophthora muscae]|uniref:Uncharacterized protein n=1 Tax=Entomophthora muscae TaxID=34485 RepID=A0ACC2SVF4_9FUNG|nr:hypothetical protein DSO57_1010308 [Entomophthora muscae]